MFYTVKCTQLSVLYIVQLIVWCSWRVLDIAGPADGPEELGNPVAGC